jgi:hypothetical protein
MKPCPIHNITKVAVDPDRDSILYDLQRLGLWVPIEHVDNGPNPLDHIGSAIQLMRRLGLELHVGMTRYSARAVFPREKCIKEIPSMRLLGADLWKDGVWFDESDVKKSICRCAIYICSTGLVDLGAIGFKPV